ncbi:helix-turn-helix protein [Novosphingobium sp. PhB165]|uniref:helix-turn-helix domain-containing protein n=1 Tax=Novosphingobium sp. PhB165 TaxID=2485105 RepID=UPI001042E8D8|nr:helix-turn-helix domain-containing protein [Novosphingobium sp. PhB165]TCM12987.1 helix-turn-helix protein [Novosphingobium sp. PhB165]
MTDNAAGGLASEGRTGADGCTQQRAKSARETHPFLTSKQAAFHLGLAVVTLKGMRRNGTGPRCRKHGRDWRYHIDDLEAWSLSNAAGGDHG